MHKEKKPPFLLSLKWRNLFKLKWLKRLLVFTVFVAIFLWGSAFFVFHFYIQPRTEIYKIQAEQWFEKEADGKLSIGKIDSQWHGLAPKVTLRDIKIQDQSEKKEPLEFKSIVLEPSWWSLLTLSPRFEYVGIEAPDLAIVRDKDGHWSINGISFTKPKNHSPKPKSNNNIINLLLQQQEIAINKANISFEDQFLSWPKLVLSEGDFYYQKNTLNQKINLQGKLDDDARFFEFDVSWKGDDINLWREWQGEADAHITNATNSSLTRYVSKIFKNASLDGDLNAHMIFSKAQLDDFKVVFNLKDVEVIDKRGYQLQLPKLSGEARIWSKEDQYYFFYAKNINLQTKEAGNLNNGLLKGDMKLGQEGFGQVQMDQINLSTLYPILGLIGAQQNPIFKDLALRGQVNNLTASWKGDTLKPHSIKLKSDFVNLSWLAAGDIPGIDKISGTVMFDKNKGKITLEGKETQLNLATLYNKPIMLDQFSGAVDINLLDNGISLGFENVKTENKDIKKIELDGRYTHYFLSQDPKPEDTLVLNVKAQQVDATVIKTLLPNIMKPKSRYWLEHAFLGGSLKNINAKITGTPKKFPFVNGEGGQFQAKADVNQLELLFSPEWPTLNKLNGQIEFKNADILINGKEGISEGIRAKKARVVIHNLKDLQNMWMDVDAEIIGSIDKFLAFTHKTPIVKWTGGFVKEVKGSGAASMNLKMRMPLQHVRDAQVWAALKLNNNAINFSDNGSIPTLNNVSGIMTFTENGVEAKEVKAKAYDGWLKMSASSTQKEKGTHFTISGSIDTQNLLSFYWPESPALAKGTSRYQAKFTVQKGLQNLSLNSDLVGTQWLVPIESLTSKPLNLSIKPTKQKGWRIDTQLGKENTGYFNIHNGQLTGAALAFGGAALPRAQRGVHILIKENKIDLESLLRADITPKKSNIRNARTNTTQKSLPIIFTLDSEHFQFADVDYGKATLRGTLNQGQTVDINLRSTKASGVLHYDLSEENKFDLHLSSFYVSTNKEASTAKNKTSTSSNQCFSVEKIPYLKVVVDQFYIDKQNYGSLSFNGQPSLQGYQIDSINLKHPNAQILGKIQLSTQKNNCARLNGSLTLKSSNFGLWLTKVDLSKQLNAGAVQLDADFIFPSINDLKLANMDGYVKLKLKEGRFINVQPGMGRILGLFDVGMLTKRITLNFKDVFLPGLSFDTIQTEGQIKKGLLTLQNFDMNAAGIKGKMNGKINLSDKTLNTRLSVYSNLTYGFFSTTKNDAIVPKKQNNEEGSETGINESTEVEAPRQNSPLTKNFHILGKWSDPTILKQ